MDIIEITGENFDGEVLQSKKPVLLDFWAPWCGPCRMQAPILDSLAGKLGGGAVIGKINVDEQPELAQQFGVMSIPTLVVIREGTVTFRASGVQTEATLLEQLQ